MHRIVRQAVILGSRTGLDQQIARRRRGHCGDRSPPAPERAKPASARAVHQPDSPGRRIGYIEPAAHRQDRPRPPAGFRCGKRPKPVAAIVEDEHLLASGIGNEHPISDTDRDKAGIDKAAARSRRGRESQILDTVEPEPPYRLGATINGHEAAEAIGDQRFGSRELSLPNSGKAELAQAEELKARIAGIGNDQLRVRDGQARGLCERARTASGPAERRPVAASKLDDDSRGVTIHHDDVAARRDGDARHGHLVGAGKLDRIAVGRSRRRFENQVACVVRGQPDAGPQPTIAIAQELVQGRGSQAFQPCHPR